MTHENWREEDGKNEAWSDESQFLLSHTEGWVRIWHPPHESMDQTCLASIVQAGDGGVMVRGIFSWQTLDPLPPINTRLNATAHQCIVADSAHPSGQNYPSSKGYLQHDNATMSKSKSLLKLAS